MEIEIFRTLIKPEAVRYVDEVTNVGLPVLIKSKHESDNELIRSGPFAGYLDKDNADAIIWIDEDAPLHIIFHEFLHLHRYWAQGMPELWDKDRGQTDMVFCYENAIEHFHIVKTEIECFPEAKNYWNSMQLKALSTFVQGNIQNQKMNLFLIYRFCELCLPETQALEYAIHYVTQNGWLNDFDEWNSELDKYVSNKIETCMKVLRMRFGDISQLSMLGVRTFNSVGKRSPLASQFIPFS